MAKYDEWATKENLTLLKGWARDGLSNEQIAHNIGINPDTLYTWKKTKTEFAEALKKNKQVADYEVENALYKKCIGYKEVIQEVKIDKDGKKTPVLAKEIYIAPDINAIKFWLVNRQRDKWKEKVEEQADDTQLKKVEELLTKLKDEADGIK